MTPAVSGYLYTLATLSITFVGFSAVCGEINVILLAIAIGLAILDYTYFLSLQLAAAIAR